MSLKILPASLALALIALGASGASAQPALVELLQRHGVAVNPGQFDVAFDEQLSPAVPVAPGSFATPLAILSSATGSERIAAAYAFGILAGRSGAAASPREVAAAGQALVSMIGDVDRRSRIAGARVAGRVFAVSLEAAGPRPAVPPGMADMLFGLLNQDHEIEQLVAMDALGLLREISATSALTERYRFYRDRNRRALAGGALEALARIGDPSTTAVVRELAGDRWAGGKDATALAVSFARERYLRDGSIAVIRDALNNRSLRGQARGYLIELGVAIP